MRISIPGASIVALFALMGCGADDTTDPVVDDGTGGEGPTGSETATNDPTWHQDVAPIVAEACVGCHNDAGIAPFSMESFEQASPFAAAMAAAVEDGIMPPWLAHDTEECVPRHGWKDDIRLSAEQQQILSDWAAAGAPEGDAATAAAMPPPLDVALPQTDLTLTMPSEVVIDGDRDQFWCFVMDSGLTEKTYFDASQVRAGNAAIVHHVLVYADTNENLTDEQISAGKYECFGGVGVNGASLIRTWAPGNVPDFAPPDVAWELDAGTRLIMQVHYHPTGEAEVDSATAIDFRKAASVPKYRAVRQFVGNFTAPSALLGGLLPGDNDPENEMEFMIPAGAKDHIEHMTMNVSDDMIIYGLGTHMHYVGTDMVIHLQHAAPADGEPERECLIHTPRWDFNWQRGYGYDAPLADVPVARAGDQFLLRCTYDNSMDNPFVREALEEQGLSAPRDVYMGEETLDEMCLGTLALAVPIEEDTTGN